MMKIINLLPYTLIIGSTNILVCVWKKKKKNSEYVKKNNMEI